MDYPLSENLHERQQLCYSSQNKLVGFSKSRENSNNFSLGILGGISFGGGFVLGGIGILTHQWWLLLMGYGFFGGLGMGFAYVPPMANLIRWVSCDFIAVPL